MKRQVLSVFLAACSIAALGCRSDEESAPKPLHFLVKFKDAKSLRPGQFLIYKGVRIGEVTAVDLDASGVKVNLTVDETHRPQVYKEAKFTIETLTLLNPTGEHQVVMADDGDVRTPMEDGTVVAGSEGWLSDIGDSIKKRGASLTSDAPSEGSDQSKPAPPSTTSSR